MKKLRDISVLLLLLTLILPAAAQTLPAPMSPPRLVNDFAGILTSRQRDSLEQKLVAFDRTTSTQITVVIVDDLQGMDRSDYAARLFDRWGIGGHGKDNGILILVKPKTGDSGGEVFISTGYGLEGAVPDALAGRIVDYDMLPAFRQGNYYAGIDRAAATLIGLTTGEFTADEYLESHKTPPGIILGMILIVGIVFVVLLVAARRGMKRGRFAGPSIDPIILGGLLGGLGRRNGGGSAGSGRFRGGGTGGFGGFGGGKTGGGGAGRSW